jgi:hypothetical protein
MTEDYLRRKLPQNFPVVYHKLKQESFVDLAENCNNICVNDFSSKNLSDKETSCLRTCYKKSIEFDAYMAHEYERIFINDMKKFNLRQGL